MYWSMGFRGIADAVGCSHSSVANRFKKIGIVPRNSQRISQMRVKGLMKRGVL